MCRSILQVLPARGVVFVASVLKSLILAVVLDVDGFAYWRAHVLYLGFVGVFALGYSDGVYLKYGGCDCGDMPFERLRDSIARAEHEILFVFFWACLALIAYVLFNNVWDLVVVTELENYIFWL